MSTKKPKTVFCKNAVVGPAATSETLSELLWHALQKCPTIGDRRQQLGESDATSDWMVIGYFEGSAESVSCALIRYTPGTAAAALIDDVSAKQVQLSRVTAPHAGAERREFIEGMLLLVVSGNRVALMQSHSVREKALENHLFWLLHNAGVLATGQGVTLCDQGTTAASAAVRKSPARSVRLSGGFTPSSDATQAASVTKGVWSAIKAVCAGDASLPLEQLDTSRVEVCLELRYEGRRHESQTALLDKLAAALRHADGVDISVVLDDGNKIDNDQLRTSGKINVQTEDGLPILSDAFSCMRSWLAQRLVA